MSNGTNNTCILYGQGCTSPTNLPEFIDTGACLCGLLTSRSTGPYAGGIYELWRCIGNASDNIGSGGHGKWYNTTLPSEELSGINEPQNWGDNPADTSQAYVLEDENGKAVYEKLGPGGSPDLIGADVNCNGINDTSLSGLYYAQGNGTSNSTSTSSSSSASPSSTTTSSSASATPTPGTTTSSAGTSIPTSSSTASASAPKSSSTSAASKFSLSSALLVGMVFAPLVSLLCS